MANIRVEGHKDLVRDENSGAVNSINTTDAAQARARKARWREEQTEHNKLKSDVDQLKNDMNVIKDLLTKLVEK